MEPDNNECEICGGTICKHGVCDCSDESCPECRKRAELEREAEREANWQREVIGPLFGWDKED